MHNVNISVIEENKSSGRTEVIFNDSIDSKYQERIKFVESDSLISRIDAIDVEIGGGSSIKRSNSHKCNEEKITEIRKRYEDFFSSRNEIKKALYRRVVICGMSMAFISSILLVIIKSILLEKLVSQSVFVLFSIFEIVLITTMILGIVIFSSVPVEEV